jgi:hypothetical protein
LNVAILSVLALLAAMQSSLPIDDARCILSGLTPPERSEIAALAERNVEPPPPLQARLEEAVADCAEERSWAHERIEPMVGLALALIIRDHTGPRLRSAGIDPVAVDSWLAQQSEQMRTNTAIAPADAERLVLDLHEGGIAMPTLEENGELLGVYVGARMIIERVERGLPLQ